MLKITACLLLLATTVQADPLVARVLYAEASPIVTEEELLLVASVIKNRSTEGNKTMRQVVLQKGQFHCIGDRRNSNWGVVISRLSGRSLRHWQRCASLAKGIFTPVTSATHYHDRSIKRPRSWKSFKLVKQTKNYKFYKED